MSDPTAPSGITRDDLMQYIAKLSPADKRILHDALCGGVSEDTHSPENTRRLFEMLKEIGIWSEIPESKQSDEQRIELYRQHGLEVSVPKGRSGFADHMMCAPHDGVPYCIDDHGFSYKNACMKHIIKGIARRASMIERHHNLIKKVYAYCTTLDRGDIWVLCGGGLEQQAFFGCSNGYLAILSLSLESDPSGTDDDMALIQSKVRTLEPQFEFNEPLFKGLKIPGVKVRHFPRNTLEP